MSKAPAYERFYNYVLCARDGVNSNLVNSTEEVLGLLDSMIKLFNEKINYASYKGYNDDIFDYELCFIGKQNKFTY